MKNPPALERLIQALRALPTVGPKSAQRMAFHLLQHDQQGALGLAKALQDAVTHLKHCQRCNTLSEQDVCSICADPVRRQDVLCVVEMPSDVMAMEQAKCFDGQYFVLMGRVSPLDGMTMKDANLDQLIKRIQASDVLQEILIATNFTAEGELTAHAISELLKHAPIKVSRIARGLPLGGELEHIDLGTLAQAVFERKSIKP